MSDGLEHGGEVTGGSPRTNFMSTPLARKADVANFVGVAAFAMRPTRSGRYLVPKTQWKKTDPVKLIAADRNLVLDTERKN